MSYFGWRLPTKETFEASKEALKALQARQDAQRAEQQKRQDGLASLYVMAEAGCTHNTFSGAGGHLVISGSAYDLPKVEIAALPIPAGATIHGIGMGGVMLPIASQPAEAYGGQPVDGTEPPTRKEEIKAAHDRLLKQDRTDSLMAALEAVDRQWHSDGRPHRFGPELE